MASALEREHVDNGYRGGPDAAIRRIAEAEARRKLRGRASDVGASRTMIPGPATPKLISALASLILASCGTTRSGNLWGESATITPPKDAIFGELKQSTLDPWTWGPLIGAVFFSIDDWDQEVSDWARRETPLFGSQRDADRASDHLRGTAHDLWLLSMAVTPSGEDFKTWGRTKLQGYLVRSVAATLTSEATEWLKEDTSRERPDSSDERSLPSGHSSAAFAYSALAWRNVDEIHMPYSVRLPARIVLIALPVGTAWARVEAGKHFPSDVLVGAAVGNFLATFINDTFMGAHDELRFQAWGNPSRGEWMFGLRWSF